MFPIPSLKATIIIAAVLISAAAGFSYWRFSSGPGPGAGPGAERVIKVGVILPLSGPGASALAAKAQEAGMRLAEKDINKKTSKERQAKVSVIIRDSALDPDRGAAAARELIAADGVDALFSSFTQVTRAVTGEALKTGTPLFYDSCNCGFAEENPLAFQIYFDPRKECRAAAETYLAKGAAKVAYIGSDVPYGKFCYQELQEVFGAENVFLEFERQDIRKPYNALIRSLRRQGAELIVSVPSVADYAALFRGNYDSGDPLPIVCFRGHCLNQSILERSRPEWLQPVTAFDFMVQDAFSRRLAGSLDDINEDTIAQAAIGYDMLAHVYEGLTRCPAGDAACIAAATRSGSYQTQIVSSGFGEDRVLQYETEYLKSFKGGFVKTGL